VPDRWQSPPFAKVASRLNDPGVSVLQVSGGWQSPPGHPGLFVAAAETSQPGTCAIMGHGSLFLKSIQRYHLSQCYLIFLGLE
jgi:hypothetical protein